MLIQRVCMLSVFVVPLAFSQWGTSTRQSRSAEQFQVRRTSDWQEGRRDGKCTIRVRIDDDADVLLRGDTLRIQIYQGRPGRDEGSECNSPLPRGGITRFRFEGVDGRGSVRLVQEPRAANGWVAAVNIKDSQGGDEGYTFDLFWESDGSSSWSSGSGSSPAWGNTGNWGDTQVRTACQEEMTARLQREHKATSVNLRGQQNAVGNGQLEYLGRANARRGNDYKRIEYRCVADPSARRIEQFEYRFAGDGSWSGSGSGSNSGWGSGSGSGWGSASSNQQTAVNNCQRAVRDKLIPQFGGYLTPQGTPSVQSLGNGVMQLTGRANYRDGSGQQGQIEYQCDANSSGGNVYRSDYRVLGSFAPRR